MTTTNETTDGWAVVAICTDGSVTEPFGTYASKVEAERICKMNNVAMKQRHVDRYEVRQLD